MPPVFVTCYICGRDFGSKSIGIHVPKCQQKWEAEQEKLPKKERRALPTAPENFDKVISGEVKGKDLVKMNQKAFDDYNESALESCQFCERTFLPKALESHRKACTEDNPMLKQKGPGYTSQMKAKVNYPKPKSKPKAEVQESIAKNKTTSQKSNKPIEEDKTVNKIIDIVPEAQTIIRKETVTLSRQTSPNILNEVKSLQNSPTASNRSTVVIETNDNSSEEALDEDKPLKKLESKSSLTRGPGTFRKKPTFVKQVSDRNIPSKDDIVALVENETIFDSLQHRKEIMEMVTNYSKDVRKKQLMSILEHPIFEETSNLEEAVDLLQDFVKMKSNNNE